MTGFRRKNPVRRSGRSAGLGLCAILVVACALSCALLWPTEARAGDITAGVLLDDARITGRTVRQFDQGGQQVILVNGNFRMIIGRRSLSAQNAVVWTTNRVVAGAVRHEITVYLEGSATVTEPDGSTSTDSTRIVQLTQQGRWSLEAGRKVQGSLEDEDLYLRADDARAAARQPGLVRTPITRPTTGEAASPPTPAAAPERSIHIDFRTMTTHNLSDLAARLTAGDETLDETQRAMAQHAVKNPNLVRVLVMTRPTIALGDPSGSDYATMTAEAAVAFTERDVAAKDARSPASIRVERLTFGENETLSGIYLDNTVTMSYGTHKMRATRVFYDFTTDRALLIQPVYRTHQTTRNVPLYIRAAQAQQLSAREVVFHDTQVSTSDFATPSYAIAAKSLRIQDQTLYDEDGREISEKAIAGQATHATLQIGGIPVFYWPWLSADVADSHTPLRRISVGSTSRFGFGVETDWDLFRLLGLARPTGVSARLHLDFYTKAAATGLEVKYARADTRRDYSGYAWLYGVLDSEREDHFGDLRKHIPAPSLRSRALMRHKEFIPEGWELQVELSYLSDRNFLEQFFRQEFWAGKDQETLLYAKKQRDNWAFTGLLQTRINNFLTQTESWPELAFFLVGQPLLDGHLTYYNETRVGIKRWKADNALHRSGINDSDLMGRADTRNELDVPLHLGALNVMPYVVGRLTAWSDRPENGENFRSYGQMGLRANMHIWRVYDDVHNRFWDLDGIKHIMTPEIIAWVSGSSADPADLFPMDPSIENFLGTTGGVAIGMHQRLQTRRGEAGRKQTVDWMRLNVFAMFLGNLTETNRQPSVGQYYFHRPEYSRSPNSLLVDYTWNISNTTAFLTDFNVDLSGRDHRPGQPRRTGRVGQFNAGFAVQRDPRVRYYVGTRILDDMHTALGVFGVSYRVNKLYTVSFFEQYDFKFNGGKNLLTTLSVIRKFPRWYTALSVSLDNSLGGVGIFLTIWPEGIPDARIGSGRFNPLGSSSEN